MYGDASQERTLLQAAVESRRAVLGVTPSDGMNLLLARRAVDMTRVPVSYVAIDKRTETVTAAQVSDAGSRVLFGREVDIEEWIHRFLHGSVCVERWRWEVGQSDAAVSESIALKPPGLPLVLERDGSTWPVDERSEVKMGDVLCLALAVNDEAVRTRLREEGWVPVETNGRYSCRR